MDYRNFRFYSHLSEIENFSDIVDLSRYSPFPDDWLVVATDIRGSTEAINSGDYKSVNMAGATAIAAICNAFPSLDIPYVFGGDGVTLALPNVGKKRIMGLLKFCKEAVKSSFGLELAAGCYTMAELRQAGGELTVCRFKLSEHITQPIFWGNGVDLIEEMIKNTGNPIDQYETVRGSFEGLECRWNEVPSDKDEILSIIIKSVAETQQERSTFYKTCLQRIYQIYGSPQQYAPITKDKMSLTASPSKLRTEMTIRSYPATISKKIQYFLKLLYMQIAGWFLMKNSIDTNQTRWGDYKTDFVKNADFRKFSDGLKLVVSGTTGQRKKLRSYLTDQYRNGNVVFGTHSSPASMTTCFVKSYQGNHIHFIDGTNGGYAAASVELKQRLKALQQKRKLFTTVKHEESIS